LERLAPFGAGNPPVVLVTEKLTLQAQRTIGRTGDHLKLTVCDKHGTTRDVVWWQAEPEKLPSGRFDLAYGVRANTYQGQREVQLVLIDLRPVDEEPQTYDQRAGVEILDFRADAEADQRRLVEGLTEAVIWNEGAAQPGIEMLRRDALERGDTLVIWTAPPGRDVLQAALDAVNPGTVYLVGVDPGMDSVNGFLQRLAGLVKHTLNQREGRAALQKLAGATAQRESTVRAGLDWMAARGHVRLVDEVDGVLHLAAGDGRAVDDPAQTTTTLATRLKETAAYRAHFRRADPASLLRR
jgi:single-stranded-DNA-specific exonuclease